MKKFAVDETVFGVRDVLQSSPGIVLGHEANGRVLVRFGDEMARSFPVASVVRATAGKDKPILRPQSRDLAEAKNLGDYLTRVGLADPGNFTKEKENEKSTR